ncbi:hypothetical protein, partial [Streptomyces sp. SID3343]|uniref:hypothetical protein n=1 Tax=Streptomyces sp. SID3343 TaxID=2690260 RepID=UPI0013687D87
MDFGAPIPPRRLGPFALTEEGIAALLGRYEFGDSCVRRVVLDQEFGPRTRGRAARVVLDVQLRRKDACWETVCLDFEGVSRFRIDESDGFSWVLFDPPMFSRFDDDTLYVDFCAEYFDGPRPTDAEQVFEWSKLVFAVKSGSWSVLADWQTVA